MAVVNWLEIGAVQDAGLGGTVWVEPGAFRFPDAGVGIAGAVIEGAKFGDVHSAVLVAAAAIAEGLKAGDSWASRLVARASFTDGVNAGDEFSAALKALVSIAEGLTVGDQFGSRIILRPGITDGVKFGDTWGARLRASASITEGTLFGFLVSLPEEQATVILSAIEILAAVEGEVHGYPLLDARSDVEPAVEGEVRINPKPS